VLPEVESRLGHKDQVGLRQLPPYCGCRARAARQFEMTTGNRYFASLQGGLLRKWYWRAPREPRGSGA